MQYLVVLASVVLAINAATDEELWSEFKKNYGRDYKDLKEDHARFSIFQQNLRKIEEHNEKYTRGEKTYHLGITNFADKSTEEFRSMLNYSRPARPNLESSSLHKVSGVQLPYEVDWVRQGAVMEVKNQGDCGSCWAFSTTGAIEAQYTIRTGYRVSLSEQNLMDCTREYGNNGCGGGHMEMGFAYVRDYGIETENDYPYRATDRPWCEFTRSLSVLNVYDWRVIRQGDEYELQDAVASVGPVSVAINADNLALYAGGIFDGYCYEEVNHGVLVVGYGTEYNTDYWLIKNSWGVRWGENGYIKIMRNRNNQCGIATDASYPILG